MKTDIHLKKIFWFNLNLFVENKNYINILFNKGIISYKEADRLLYLSKEKL